MQAINEVIYTDNHPIIHVIHTEKFKTITFHAKIRSPLRRETVSKRALLSQLFQQGTERFPSNRKLKRALAHLYGAQIFSDCTKKGNNHVLHLQLDVVNDRYLHHETNVFNEASKFVKEILYEPYRIEGIFPETVIEREKASLMKKLQALKDDKLSYANQRLIDEMCADESYSLHTYGYVSDLEKLTSRDVSNYFDEMLREGTFDLYVIGDFKEERVLEAISRQFQRPKNELRVEETDVQEMPQDEKIVIETDKIEQTKLHLGFRTNCTYSDNLYYALLVFNGLLGGFPSSRLFMEIREKNHLCYYIASRVESQKGLLFVYCGIEPMHVDKVKQMILNEIELLQNGQFTEAELDATKQLVINETLRTVDYPVGIVEFLYQQVIANVTITFEQMIEKLNAVTKEDVVKLAKNVVLDTTYVLTNDEVETGATKNV